jgi:hypothetical protein
MFNLAANLPARVGYDLGTVKSMRNGTGRLCMDCSPIRDWVTRCRFVVCMPRDKVMEAGVKSLASAFATDEPLHAMDAFWARRRQA